MHPFENAGNLHDSRPEPLQRLGDVRLAALRSLSKGASPLARGRVAPLGKGCTIPFGARLATDQGGRADATLLV